MSGHQLPLIKKNIVLLIQSEKTIPVILSKNCHFGKLHFNLYFITFQGNPLLRFLMLLRIHFYSRLFFFFPQILIYSALTRNWKQTHFIEKSHFSIGQFSNRKYLDRFKWTKRILFFIVMKFDPIFQQIASNRQMLARLKCLMQTCLNRCKTGAGLGSKTPASKPLASILIPHLRRRHSTMLQQPRAGSKPLPEQQFLNVLKHTIVSFKGQMNSSPHPIAVFQSFPLTFDPISPTS